MSNNYVQPAGTHNDAATGNMPFGSQVVTIPTTGGVSYIANSISPKKSSSSIMSKNEVGVAYRETLVDEPFTGDMELQLADVTTAAPSIGMPFTIVDVGGGVLNCKVSDVSPKFTAGGETLVSVSFKKRFAN